MGARASHAVVAVGALVTVAYAHVLLEISAAVLLLAAAARLLGVDVAAAVNRRLRLSEDSEGCSGEAFWSGERPLDAVADRAGG